jgi:hypothetical protein
MKRFAIRRFAADYDPDMRLGPLGLVGFVVLAGGVGLLGQATAAGMGKPGAMAQVPFVGCASDGQLGPVKAPTGSPVAVMVDADAAPRLAYYKAENGFGVLAPRGWHCFSTYGSDGSNLFVSLDPIDTTNLFSPDWKGLRGQAIQVSVSYGGTSGRFAVARTIARVFPDFKAFAQQVIAEGIEPASSFPSGPYPRDKLTYVDKKTVEFETPANTKGLGTDSRLQIDASPIQGVAVLFGSEMDLVQLSVRVSEKDRDLVRPILLRIEGEVGSETQ